VSRARSAYRRFAYEVRHPENHKQLMRFLCVGVSGYVVNIATFAFCIHVLKLSDAPSLVAGFFTGGFNNFHWNRHWTFSAQQEHAFRQCLRFFAVSAIVFGFATGVYDLELALGMHMKVMADGISWVIATPLSFVVQKLWSFKA
jgi:putative flippase GtrA